MTMVICSRHGRTPSCHKCPDGKPHEKEELGVEGYLVERVICTESKPFQEVTKVKVRTNN